MAINFKQINWNATMKVNLIRAFVAGIIWAIFMFVMYSSDPSSAPGNTPFASLIYPLVVPIGYFLFLLPLGVVCGWISNLGVPFIGLVSLFPAIIIFPADPVMFFIHKYNSNLIPVESYKFIEPHLSIWVMNERAI